MHFSHHSAFHHCSKPQESESFKICKFTLKPVTVKINDFIYDQVKDKDKFDNTIGQNLQERGRFKLCKFIWKPVAVKPNDFNL